MKLNLLLVAFLFTVLAVFTTSCGTDTPKDKTCDPACGAWEECNPSTGTCDLLDSFCNADTDCATAGYVCNSSHKCQEPIAEECKNQCLDQNGVLQGECSVIGGLPVCACNEGFLTSPNKLRCLEPSAECKDETLACGGNGECVANNAGTLECKCDTDYIPDATDPMSCSPTVICSNSNHNGTCEASCEECLDDGTGNWACKVPDGERPCYKNFNDQCDPSLGYSNNPGCAADMYCEGNDATDGYCTTTECKIDIDCATTYGDQFSCKYYGEGFIGICIKGADSCFNADGTRVGLGEEGDPCSDECQEADCVVGNLCLGGTCSKKCSGPMDLTCSAGKGCADISGGSGLYYCVEIAGIGEDCSGGAACVNDGWCLGNGVESYCFDKCTVAALNSDECGGEECVDFGDGFYCEIAPSRQEGEVCDMVNGCVDNGWCLGSGVGDSYCFNSCTTAAANSDECGGQECVHFGTAPNDGYYCEIAPSKQEGEVCDMVNTCVDNGWCLGSGEGDSYCFNSCTTAAANSDECGGQECVHFGTTPNDGYYCEIAPSRDFGDECDMVNTCTNDGLCLTTTEASTCFEGCTDATSTCTQENYACVDTGSPSIGWICMEQTPPGNTAIGGDCSGVDTDPSKNCVAGATCLTDTTSSICYEDCDVNTGGTCSTTGYTCEAIASGDTFCFAPAE
jgi:hypothetical protein